MGAYGAVEGDAHFELRGVARAINTARLAIPTQREVVRPECLSDYIVSLVRGRFEVTSMDAWQPPAQPGLLPWSLPDGLPVVRVSVHDGTVTMLDGGILIGLLCEGA